MAMVTAISPSVTVSMGELTMGVLMRIFLVTLVVRSTYKAASVCHVTMCDMGTCHDGRPTMDNASPDES